MATAAIRQLPLFQVAVDEDAILGVTEVLRSGWIGEGQKVRDFEHLLGDFIGTNCISTVNSCTSAIVLALRLAGVSPGSEVITTPMTCTATNHAILQAGGRIVWADVDPFTGNIDPQSAKSRITDATRAIVAVHWGGLPCALDELNALGRERGIPIIEDAAHALGSEYKGQRIGLHSDFICFSFQAIKCVTTGDGGAIVCRRTEDDSRARLLRWFGIERGKAVGEYDIAEYGYKFHMNDIAAAIGISGMRQIDSRIAARRRNGLLYEKLLEGIPGVQIHKENAEERSAYWLCNLLVENRPDFIRKLADRGVAASPVHLRNDVYTAFRPFRCDELPGVDYFDPRHVSVPVGPWISEEDVHYVAGVIREGW